MTSRSTWDSWQVLFTEEQHQYLLGFLADAWMLTRVYDVGKDRCCVLEHRQQKHPARTLYFPLDNPTAGVMERWSSIEVQDVNVLIDDLVLDAADFAADFAARLDRYDTAFAAFTALTTVSPCARVDHMHFGVSSEALVRPVSHAFLLGRVAGLEQAAQILMTEAHARFSTGDDARAACTRDWAKRLTLEAKQLTPNDLAE